MPNRLSGPAGSNVKVSCALRALGTAVLTLAEAASAAAKEMLHACPFPGVSWQADTGPGGVRAIAPNPAQSHKEKIRFNRLAAATSRPPAARLLPSQRGMTKEPSWVAVQRLLQSRPKPKRKARDKYKMRRPCGRLKL